MTRRYLFIVLSVTVLLSCNAGNQQGCPPPSKLDVVISKDVMLLKPDKTIPIKPDITIIKPDITIPKPDIKISKPDLAIPKPDINIPKPDITIPKPDIKIVKPDITIPKPDLRRADLLRPDLIKPDLPKPKPDLLQPDQYIPPVVSGDWFIRPNGGTRAQCTGKTDADYLGTGTNQPCAFKHPYYLFTNDVSSTASWIIAGGDTVIIRGGPYKMGYKGPNPSDGWSFCLGSPFMCFAPSIPAGTATKHTRILGENYANCSVKTKLLGSYGNRMVLNLQGAKWADVECFELTDSAQCGRMGNSNFCSSNYPLDDYVTNGIVFDINTANLTLKNVDIHGISSTGVAGPVGGNVTFENSRIAFNPSAGWDLDNGIISTGGTVRLLKTVIEWNGCIEQYPIVNAVPAFRCFDDNSGGYGDGIGTPDAVYPNWIIDQSTIRYNTSDGLDLLHQSGDVSVVVTRSAFYGNMGQQYKSGAIKNTTVQNNIIIHNCNRLSASFPGAPTGYNSSLSSFCRAAGDGIAISFSPTGTFRFENNTYVGYGATTMDIGCRVAECNGMNGILRNNIFFGILNPPYNAGQRPGMFYYQDGTRENQWQTRSNNIYFGMRNSICPSNFSSETCGDPRFVNAPTFVTEADIDSYNLHLQSTSPAVNSGATIPEITIDNEGRSRPQGSAYDIGALEYTQNISIGEFNKLFQNKSFIKTKMKKKMSVNMCISK